MDTLVSTEDGLRPIEEIQAGDYVWSENTETDKKELKKVLSVSVTETTTLVHVTTENGTVINTTENHPFYVEGKGWCAAAELEAGDVLRTEDGEQETVKSVQTEKLDKAVKVYNLEIEDSHTYYVSADSVLVHNACAPRKPRRPKSNVDEVVFNSDLSSHYKKTYNGQQYMVSYSAEGYPDFSDYLYNGTLGKNSTEIEYSGNRDIDIRNANNAAGFHSTPDGYTWHHVEDARTMQLVLSEVHKLFPHTGGFSIFNHSKSSK